MVRNTRECYKIPLECAPAARPRVTRQGWSFYPKKYKNFKAALGKWFTENAVVSVPSLQAFTIGMVITIARPKTSKLDFPRPDVDNYAKSVLDAGTKVLWHDDTQCRRLLVEKQWGDKNEIDIQINWKS